MTDQPKISVIIPVYNVEKYLEACINSILSQSLKEIEIICIDDGSSDHSLEVLRSLSKKDNRIAILNQKNQGPAIARNKGLQEARGEFVIFMDSDDLYPTSDILETLYKKAKENKVLICGGELIHFDEKGSEFDNSVYAFEKEGIIKYRDYQLDYGFTRFIFNRSFLIDNEIYFPDQICFEDPVFFVKAMNAADAFYAVKKTVYAYRTSHKEVKWSQRRVLDVLQGIETNLKYSKEFGLDNLHQTTNSRLYSDWILREICPFLTKKVVFDQFLKTVFQINWDKAAYTSEHLKQKIFKHRSWTQKKIFKKNYKLIAKYLLNLKKIFETTQEIIRTEGSGQDINLLPEDYNCKVSVIVPIFNVEKYLDKCLQSIINQSYKNIEIICVNDGSTDNSAEIIKKYADLDCRIKVITQKNQGLSAARNAGMRAASAEYLMFIDSDDWIEKDTVQTALSAMCSDASIDIVNFGIRIVFEENPQMFLYRDDRDIKYHAIKLTGKHNLDVSTVRQMTVTACNKLYKKSIIDKFGLVFPEGLSYEDNAFFYEYCLHAGFIYCLDRYQYNYLQRLDSIMGSMFNKKSAKIVDRLKIFDIVYNYYKKSGKLLEYKQLIAEFFNGCLWNDYNHCPKNKQNEVLKYAGKLAKTYDPKYFDDGVIKHLVKKKYHKLKMINYTNFMQRLCSAKKEKDKRIIRILGIKIKFKKKVDIKKLLQQELNFVWLRINKLTEQIKNQITDIQNNMSSDKKEVEALQKRVAELSWQIRQYGNLFDKQIMDDFLDNKNGANIESILNNAQYISGPFYENKLCGMRRNLDFLFKGTVLPNNFDSNKTKCDAVYLWGIKPSLEQTMAIEYAQKNKTPVIIIEDSFLRSACTWADETKDLKYRVDYSFTVDDLTSYYDASRPSRLETMLNDKNLIITAEQKKRAGLLIDKIVSTKLTKYNHQPVYTPNIGRKGVKKVLVVDQSYGDMSVQKGRASDNTFAQMLQAAIDENPDADIIVKTHPDTMTGVCSGYYSNLKERDNVYRQTDPINPISLIEYVDKVYVCTTQFGFEALMCGKEVHVFGMPFYAGWGLTHDRQKCERRTHSRDLEELFYISYILYTHWVDPKNHCSCEIETAMDRLLELREEYRHEQN